MTLAALRKTAVAAPNIAQPTITQPTIALFSGDPAGIGPELVAKLLTEKIADKSALANARVILIGNAAGFETDFDRIEGVSVHDWDGLAAPACERGVVSQANGRYMLTALTEGARLEIGRAHV